MASYKFPSAHQAAFGVAYYDTLLLFVSFIAGLVNLIKLLNFVDDSRKNGHQQPIVEDLVFGRIPVRQDEFIRIFFVNNWMILAIIMALAFILARLLFTGLEEKRLRILISWLLFQVCLIIATTVVAILSITMTMHVSACATVFFTGVISSRVICTTVVYRAMMAIVDEIRRRQLERMQEYVLLAEAIRFVTQTTEIIFNPLIRFAQNQPRRARAPRSAPKRALNTNQSYNQVPIPAKRMHSAFVDKPEVRAREQEKVAYALV